MLYHFIDESYTPTPVSGIWHCYIGGPLIDGSRLAELEVELAKVIWTADRGEAFRDGLRRPVLPIREFGSTDFFCDLGYSDDELLVIFRNLLAVMKQFDVKYLISAVSSPRRAFARFRKIFPRQGGLEIQDRAFQEIPFHLAPRAQDELIQMVIDLGLSESFQKEYEMYVSSATSLVSVIAVAGDDDGVALRQWRNLPCPVFISSKSSRVMQMTDMVVGLCRWKAEGSTGSFKQLLYDAFEMYLSDVTIELENLDHVAGE